MCDDAINFQWSNNVVKMLRVDSTGIIKGKHRPHKHFNFPDTLSKHSPAQIGWLNAESLTTDSVDVLM